MHIIHYIQNLDGRPLLMDSSHLLRWFPPSGTSFFSQSDCAASVHSTINLWRLSPKSIFLPSFRIITRSKSGASVIAAL